MRARIHLARHFIVVTAAVFWITAAAAWAQNPASPPPAGSAAPGANAGDVPKGYIGKWKGVRGKATTNSRGRVGTAIVTKDFGHVIDKFEFEVAANGTITGHGTATYWFDIAADADLLVARSAPESHLEGNSQAVTFKITGKMFPGRAELKCTPDKDLVLINAGKRTTMGAWNVFGPGAVHVSKTDDGLVLHCSRVIEQLGMKLEWEARKGCPNPLDVAKDLAATKFNGWTYGASAAQQQVDCVQFVLATVEKLHGQPLPQATRTRILISDVTGAQVPQLVAAEDSRIKGVQQALVDIDHGTVVQPADAQPGDFVQYWMKKSDGTWMGHSAVVAEVLTDAAGAPDRIKILGAQSSDNGIATHGTPIKLSGGGRKMFVVRYKCESSHGCCGK